VSDTSGNDTGASGEDCGKIAKSLGSTVYHCSNDHDRAVISHLPVMVCWVDCRLYE